MSYHQEKLLRYPLVGIMPGSPSAQPRSYRRTAGEDSFRPITTPATAGEQVHRLL
jgi:hypothetical protein